MKTFLLPALLFLPSLFSFPAAAVANPLELAVGYVDYHGPVISASTDFGKHWKDKILDGPSIDLVKCTADASTCIGTSSMYYPQSDPGVFRGTNKGLEWTRIHLNIPHKEPNISGIGCTGSGKSTTCFMAGQDRFDTSPIIRVSSDTGLTWVIPPIIDLPKKGGLGTATCTDGEADAVCVIAGSGFMLLSSDGGRNWSVKNLPTTVSNNIVDKISCTGHGANAICTAIYFHKPQIVVTHDGGNTWMTTHIESVNGASFSGVSCTGEAPTAICIVTGSSYDTPKKESMTPFLAVSTDNANNFIVNPSSILQFKGNMGAVSCVGNGSNAVCEAIGEKSTGSIFGAGSSFLARSKDGANTWTQQELPKKYWLGKKYTYSLKDINCQFVDSNVACTVLADAYSYSQAPLPAVFTTNDIDSDWNIFHWGAYVGVWPTNVIVPVWAQFSSVSLIAGA